MVIIVASLFNTSGGAASVQYTIATTGNITKIIDNEVKYINDNIYRIANTILLVKNISVGDTIKFNAVGYGDKAKIICFK